MNHARLTFPQVHVMLEQLRKAEAFTIEINAVAGIITGTHLGQPVLKASRTETFNVWDVEYHPTLWKP